MEGVAEWGEVPTVCCAIAVMGLLGPRALILFWWLIDPARWNLVFQGFLLPALGFVFLPWTTIAYVLFWTVGGLDFIGWVVVALAFVLDIGTYGGGAFGNRERVSGYYRRSRAKCGAGSCSAAKTAVTRSVRRPRSIESTGTGVV